MTCKDIQHQLLLLQSGEDNGDQRDVVAAHLLSCDNCRAYRNDLQAFTAAEEAMEPVRDVSELTLARIRRRAKRKAPSFYQTWRPAILYAAAAVALLLFTLRFVDRQEMQVVASRDALQQQTHGDAVWDDTWEDDMRELDQLVSALESVDSGESVEEIAEDLLELEAWNI